MNADTVDIPLTLTIDAGLQDTIREELKAAVSKFKPKARLPLLWTFAAVKFWR